MDGFVLSSGAIRAGLLENEVNRADDDDDEVENVSRVLEVDREAETEEFDDHFYDEYDIEHEVSPFDEHQQADTRWVLVK